MIKLNGLKTVDLPYTIRVHGVDEALFDELVDENTRAELIDGVMIVHSPATIEHDDISHFVRTLMRLFARRTKQGKVHGPDSLVRLASGRRFGPDGYFIRRERVPPRRPKLWTGAPDQIVEILSPSNREIDLEEKRPAYRAAGVREIWFIDPAARQVTADRKVGRRYVESVYEEGRVASEVLKGFWLEVAWLWMEELPDEVECLEEICNR